MSIRRFVLTLPALVLVLVLLVGFFPGGAAFAEGGGDPLALRFVCDETVASVTVYDPAGVPLPVGADGIHHLTPGTYFYSATAEGYENTGLQAFTIPADAAGDQELRISLTPVPGSVPPGPSAPGETPSDALVPGQLPQNSPDPNALKENPEDDGKLRIRPVNGSLTLTIERETKAESAVPPELQKLLEGKQKPLLTADGKPVEKKLWLKTPDAEELYLDRLAVEKEIGYYTTDWTVLNLTDEEGARKNLVPASGWYDVTVSGPATEPYRAYEPVFALVTLHWDEEGDIVDRDVQILETTHTPTKSSWSFSTDTLSTLVIAVPTDRPVESEEAAAKKDRPAFAASSTVDGVTVTVSAPAGVFPADAALWVQRVPLTEEIDAAVEAERDEQKTVAVSYTFDIRVVNPETTEEYQPEEGQSVSVSFALAEVADENLETRVYHVTEEESTGALTAEALDVSESGLTATAETDGFSYYQVEFTYEKLEYVLPGDTSVPLAEILMELGLSGDVTEVSCSNANLFSCDWTENRWVVTAHRAFSSTEWMKVTLNSVVYEITVTDEWDQGFNFEDIGNGEAKITYYTGSDENVVIPETVTDSNEIEYTVTSIGESAFNDCDSLQSIEIPSGVTSIGDYAFEGCGNLESVTFAEGSALKSIGDSAFDGCSSLTGVTLKDCSSLQEIGADAFHGCSSLTSITIPASVTSIGEDAFGGCNLESMTIRRDGTTPLTLASNALSASGTDHATLEWTGGNIPDGQGLKFTITPGNAGYKISDDNSTLSWEVSTSTATLTAEVGLSVSYVDENGAGKTAICTPITETTTLDGGWYALTKDVTAAGSINISGEVNLILCSGKTYTLDYVFIGSGGSLTLWGQSAGSGTIQATSVINPAIFNNGTLTMHAGTVMSQELPGVDSESSFTMNGGTVRSGIYGVVIDGGSFTMNGGTVDGGSTGVSIYGGSFTMNGGTVESGGNGVSNDDSGSFLVTGDAPTTITGGGVAIYGTVKNKVAGTGWDNTAGSGTSTRIPISEDGQTFYYKKVRFSAVPDPATAPTINMVTGADLTFGYTSGSVGVSVTPATDADYTMIYQWYSNTSDSNTGGTVIDSTSESTAATATYTVPTGKNAGNYYYYCVVTVTRTDNGQTTSATSDVATVEVKPAAVTLTANSRDTDVYDGTEKTVTGFTSSVNGLTFADTVTASGSGKTAGEYDVTFTGVTVNETRDSSGNYVVGEATKGKLTIQPSTTPLEITSSTMSWTYDAQTHHYNVYTVTYGSESYNVVIAEGETSVEVTLSTEDKLTITTTAPGVKDYSANYDKNNTFDYDLLNAGSYSSVSTTFGTLSITKADLTIAMADRELPYNADTQYGWSRSDAGEETVTGLVNNETVTITYTPASGVTAGTCDNGSYDVDTLNIKDGDTDVTNNYNLTSATAGTLTISRAPLTITALPQTLVYNGQTQGEGDTAYNDPAEIAEKITVGEGQLKGNDTVTSVTLDGQGEKAGEYALVASNAAIGKNGEKNKNYAISYVPGKLTILPVYDMSIDVTAGGSVSASPSSAAAGDTVTLTVTADAGSELTGLTVSTDTGAAVELAQDQSNPNLYTFTMPAAPVRVSASFARIVYTVTEGKDASWLKGSRDGLSVTVKRSPHDESCFGHFTQLLVDGDGWKDGRDYTAAAGSTVVTLKAKTLNRLSAGKHTLTFAFDDGAAETTLTILVPPGGYSPGTGDSSRLGLWAAVMLLAGLGFAGADFARRKFRRPRYVGKHM